MRSTSGLGGTQATISLLCLRLGALGEVMPAYSLLDVRDSQFAQFENPFLSKACVISVDAVKSKGTLDQT